MARLPESSPRELTPRALALGLLLAVLLGAANAYLGLFAGLTVSASIPAAVVSMALLRLAGRATILENNIVQAIASAGEAVAAGAIFTFPALVVLGWRPQDLSYWQMTLLCAVGATLGSLLVVFLRRAYVVEERLPFPEGVACAEVLRAGEAGGVVLAPLLTGGVFSGGLKALQDLAGVIPAAAGGARWLYDMSFAVSCDFSAALLGVGYLVGPSIAAIVLAGALLAWMILVPLLSLYHPELRHLAANAAADALWRAQVRFVGVGAMLTGGLATLWRMRAPIGRALLRTRVTAYRSGDKAAASDRDLPAAWVITAVLACIPVMAVLYAQVVGQWGLAIGLAPLLAAIAFFACAVSGYLTGLVGASNNPVSGVTLIVVLAVALFLKLLGSEATAAPTLTILVSAVVATAAAMAGDSLHDLATGYHVGATPRSLELAILVGALISAALIGPVLKLLLSVYGIAGMPHASNRALAAPQAFLIAQVVRGVFAGGLPWPMVGLGALLALVLEYIDSRLAARASHWRTAAMPLAIGLYLPLGLSVTIALGALAGWLADQPSRRATLLAAGLVAGEALVGVISAVFVTLGGHL